MSDDTGLLSTFTTRASGTPVNYYNDVACPESTQRRRVFSSGG